jgi:hypothetical protein
MMGLFYHFVVVLMSDKFSNLKFSTFLDALEEILEWRWLTV